MQEHCFFVVACWPLVQAPTSQKRSPSGQSCSGRGQQRRGGSGGSFPAASSWRASCCSTWRARGRRPACTATGTGCWTRQARVWGGGSKPTCPETSLSGEAKGGLHFSFHDPFMIRISGTSFRFAFRALPPHPPSLRPSFPFSLPLIPPLSLRRSPSCSLSLDCKIAPPPPPLCLPEGS